MLLISRFSKAISLIDKGVKLEYMGCLRIKGLGHIFVVEEKFYFPAQKFKISN